MTAQTNYCTHCKDTTPYEYRCDMVRLTPQQVAARDCSNNSLPTYITDILNRLERIEALLTKPTESKPPSETL